MSVGGRAVRIVNGRPLGYLMPKEFAERMDVSVACVRAWIQRGKLQALKIGSDNWIREDAIVYTNIRSKCE